MSGPTLALGISAPGYQQVIQMAEAVERLDRAIGGLSKGGGGSQLSGLAALTSEVSKIRQELGTSAAALRTDLADLGATVSKGLAEAFGAIAKAATTNSAKASTEVKKAMEETEAAAKTSIDRFTAQMMVGSAKYEKARVDAIAKEGEADKKYLYRMMVGSAQYEAARLAQMDKESDADTKYTYRMMAGSAKIAEQSQAAAAREEDARLGYRVKMMTGSLRIAEQLAEAAEKEDAARLNYRIKLMAGSYRIAEEADKAAAREDEAKLTYRIKMMTGSAKIAEAAEVAALKEDDARLGYRVKMMTGSLKIAEEAEKAAAREQSAMLAWIAKMQVGSLKIADQQAADAAREIAAAQKKAEAIDLASKTVEAAYQAANARTQARINLKAGAQLDQGIAPALVQQRFGPTAFGAANAASTDQLRAAYEALGPAARRAGEEHERASPKIKGLADQMNNAHSAARGLASGFGAMFLTWGAILPLLAGAAVSNGFVQVIKQGAEVQNTFTQIRVLAGASAEEIVMLNSEMSEMAKTSQFGPKQLADAMKTLSLAGLTAREVFSSVHDVLNFAVAGDTDIKQAADVMTTVATAFHVSAQGYGMVGDVISKAAAESKSSVESMGAAFKTASVINQQYGVTLEDTAVGLALLANAGIQGTAAGTSLRNMYADLAGRTPKVSKALKELGVDVLDVNGKMKDQAVIFEQVMKGLAKFDGKSQFKLIQDIFSERGTKDAGAIMDALGSKAKELGSTAANAYDELAKKIAESAGFAATAAAQMSLTPLNQMKSVVATLQNTLVGAFEEMQPFVLDFSMKLKEAFNSDEFKSSLQSLLSLVADLTMGFVDHGKVIMSLIATYVGFRAVIGIMAAVSAATLAWSEVTVAATTAVGVAGRAAAVANPLLAGLTAILTLGAAAWAMYEMWASKSKDTLKDLGTNNASALLKRLEEEEDRLKKVNAARSQGITLMELEAKAALEKARNEVSPELATARKALADFDSSAPSKPYSTQVNPLTGKAETVRNDETLRLTERAKLVAAVTAAEVAHGDVLLRTERAMLGINAASQEAARLEKEEMARRTRVTGTKVYTGVNDKAGRETDTGAIQSEMERDMAFTRDANAQELKQLQDKYRAEEISAGEYGAKVIGLREDLETKLNAIADRETKKYDQAYSDRIAVLTKTTQGKALTDALNALGNHYEQFSDKVAFALMKADNATDTSLADMTSQYEQATNKMVKTDAAYWKRADQTMMKNLAQSQSLREMAGASEEARVKAEAMSKVDAAHSVELEKLQTELSAAQKASEDFNKEMGNGAISDDESHNKFGEALVARVLLLKQALADANSEMNRLRFLAGQDAINDLVNKQNQKWRDEAVKMGKEVTGKLADWLLSGGKGGFKSLFDWAKDYLIKNPFKMVLQAVLQPIANGVTNIALQALGLGTTNGSTPGMVSVGGGGGGNIVNTISTGKSLYDYGVKGYNYFTGSGAVASSGASSGLGLAATTGSGYAIYGGAGAASTGLAATTAGSTGYGLVGATSGGLGLSATTGGAAIGGTLGTTGAAAGTGSAIGGGAVAGGAAEGGAMAGLAAIPVWGWIALAVIAIGSMMAKKGGGPKVDGMAGLGMNTDIQHGQYDQALVPVLTSTQGQYDSITKLMGGTSKAQFGIAVTSDPQGDSPTFVQSRAQVNGQDVFSDLNRNVGREDADMQAEVKHQTERSVLAALRASDITGAFADWVRNLGDVTGQALDDAFARIDRVMNERTTLQSRLDDLKNANKAAVDAVTALEDARKKEAASYDELNKDILDRIYAQEDLKSASTTSWRRTTIN
jgi:TP901 family phage tail tape measure protein